MKTPAAFVPWKRTRLTIVAVKIPSGIADPNCRNPHHLILGVSRPA
jgi:hypothetical protein